MVKLVCALALAASVLSGASAQGWFCYGGNAQHSGIFNGTTQSAALIKWQTPIDDDPAIYGTVVYAHFAAPTVSPTNTVVYALRRTVGSNYDNWSVIGKAAATGKTVWQVNTDFSAVELVQANTGWTSVFPMTLFQSTSSTARGMACAAAGGTVMVRKSADLASSTTSRLVFYTTVSDYNTNASKYAPIKIDTPITADASGNLFFGYQVTGSIPSSLSALGTGGIAEINANTGKAIYKSVTSMGINQNLNRPAINAAPALTTDGKYIYVGLCDGGNNTPYLAKLATKDLSTSESVRLLDPYATGQDVILLDSSTASPMIGPDGNVFYGVFRNGWAGESHGWMLQYNQNLSGTDASGKAYPVGAFGWDDTAVIVPSTIVPTYNGKAKYLILTKYNNYGDWYSSDPAANGTNKVAILDPTSNSLSRDRMSPAPVGIPVMNEIITVQGVTKNPNTNLPGVCEWCINSAAIDVARKSAIVNSEDGHMYRWSFVSNSLVENIPLEEPTSEAYTMTAIGPDGTMYVINDCELFAIGSNNATAVKTIQGTKSKGTLADVWYVDGTGYSTDSVGTSSGQTATIEADFELKTNSETQFTVSCNVTGATGANAIIYAYNYKTKAFTPISAATSLSTSPTLLTASVGTNASQYIGPGGAARIQIKGIKTVTATTSFELFVDEVTCGSN